MQEIPIGRFGYVKKEVIDWVKMHRNIATLGGALVVVALMGAGQMMRWAQEGDLGGGRYGDYISAESAYRKWSESQEGFEKLEKLIRKHPELYQKYEGAIAQRLLLQTTESFLPKTESSKEVRPVSKGSAGSSADSLIRKYAASALRRVGDFSPYYIRFSKESLLIGEGKLKEALEGAKKLKADMDKDEVFWSEGSQIIRHGSLLYAYNLLRIAMLEKTAGSLDGELAAWKEFKHNAGWLGTVPSGKSYDPDAYLLLQQNFQKSDISLRDYVAYREKMIMQKGSANAGAAFVPPQVP